MVNIAIYVILVQFDLKYTLKNKKVNINVYF